MTQHIKQLIENNTWRDISEAPKDGTPVIVNHAKAGVCEAFYPKEGFSWHVMDGRNTVIGSKSGVPIPVLTSFVEPPESWMPLPDDRLAKVCEVLVEAVRYVATEPSIQNLKDDDMLDSSDFEFGYENILKVAQKALAQAEAIAKGDE